MSQLDVAVEFATNPEPRCACVLLLDVSGSMAGAPIAALNEGLSAFAADIGTDVLARQVHRAEEANGLAFFAVGVKGANLDVLGQIAVRPPLKLDGLKFVELFVWLSQSQRRVSSSKPGDQTALPAVDGWASV